MFDFDEVCFFCESRTLYTPEGCLEQWNVVESIEVVFKNGESVYLIKTNDLCKKLGFNYE